MNEFDPTPGRKSLQEFVGKPKLNSHGQEPLESVQGRESTHGRHPQFSLNVVRENGNETGVLYGLLLSAPYFDPSRGIRLIFEGWHIETWDDIKDGVFLVTITGSNLHDIANHIKSSAESRIALGDNVTGFEVTRLPTGKK